MASRQCMLAMELKDIETKNFDGSLAKLQILSPVNKLCYTVHHMMYMCSSHDHDIYLTQIFMTTAKLFYKEFLRRTIVLVAVMFTLSFG